MAKTASQISAKIALLPALREELTKKLEEAKAREVLVVGNKYPLYRGKGENRTVVEGELLKQRTNEDGGTEFLFEVADEFEPVRCTARALATDTAKDAEGKKLPSSAGIAKRLAALADAEEVLETQLLEALEREQLTVGQTYNIRVGRGDSAEVVPAVLLGEGISEKSKTVVVDGVETIKTTSTKQLNFFYGAGFEARTILTTAKAVVLASAEDDAEAAAEATAEAAQADAEDQADE